MLNYKEKIYVPERALDLQLVLFSQQLPVCLMPSDTCKTITNQNSEPEQIDVLC